MVGGVCLSGRGKVQWVWPVASGGGSDGSRGGVKRQAAGGSDGGVGGDGACGDCVSGERGSRRDARELERTGTDSRHSWFHWS